MVVVLARMYHYESQTKMKTSLTYLSEDTSKAGVALQWSGVGLQYPGIDLYALGVVFQDLS